MNIYILGAKRTAIGSLNGCFTNVSVSTLGARALEEAILQTSLDKNDIQEVIFGNVLQAGCGQGPARQAMIEAGLDVSIPCYSINKLCGSGLKAVMLGAQAIKAGDVDIVATGGMENMTRAPHLLPMARQGYRLGSAEIEDHLIKDGLIDAFHGYHMGITAENIADKYNISREKQDEFAFKSQKKAISAIEKGYFEKEIIDVVVRTRKGEVICNKDEHPNFDISIERLSKMRSAFKKEGTVTAGNASGINDGAAAIILGNDKSLEKGSKPLAKIISYANGAMEPSIMGLTPTIAIKKALKLAKMDLKDIELIELNEAFAVQSLGVLYELKQEFNITEEWIEERVNTSGGAVALGHPIGASGARCLTTLLYSMERLNKKYGMVSLCIGGGLAVAMIIEKL